MSVLLTILIFSFYWPVSNMAFSLPLCPEGQHPGVTSQCTIWHWRFAGTIWWSCQLRTCEGSISQTRDSDVLVFLFSCAAGPPTSSSTLVGACLRCPLKGVVHTVVGNLQFLGNFSRWIAFISKNNNRLSSLTWKFSFSGHFESLIEPTNVMLQILN